MCCGLAGAVGSREPSWRQRPADEASPLWRLKRNGGRGGAGGQQVQRSHVQRPVHLRTSAFRTASSDRRDTIRPPDQSPIPRFVEDCPAAGQALPLGHREEKRGVLPGVHGTVPLSIAVGNRHQPLERKGLVQPGLGLEHLVFVSPFARRTIGLAVAGWVLRVLGVTPSCPSEVEVGVLAPQPAHSSRNGRCSGILVALVNNPLVRITGVVSVAFSAFTVGYLSGTQKQIGLSSLCPQFKKISWSQKYPQTQQVSVQQDSNQCPDSAQCDECPNNSTRFGTFRDLHSELVGHTETNRPLLTVSTLLTKKKGVEVGGRTVIGIPGILCPSPKPQKNLIFADREKPEPPKSHGPESCGNNTDCHPDRRIAGVTSARVYLYL